VLLHSLYLGDGSLLLGNSCGVLSEAEVGLEGETLDLLLGLLLLLLLELPLLLSEPSDCPLVDSQFLISNIEQLLFSGMSP